MGLSAPAQVRPTSTARGALSRPRTRSGCMTSSSKPETTAPLWAALVGFLRA
jgi:hypothetical protein